MNGDRLREIGAERGEETAQKDAAYASGYLRGGQCMALFFPNGIPPGEEAMMRAGLIFRTLDKLCREAHLINTGAPDAFGENPWADVCGYAILGTALAEQRQPTGAPTHELEAVSTQCFRSPDPVLNAPHSGDCVNREGVRMIRDIDLGRTCSTPGCDRTPGHLDECMGAKGVAA